MNCNKMVNHGCMLVFSVGSIILEVLYLDTTRRYFKRSEINYREQHPFT